MSLTWSELDYNLTVASRDKGIPLIGQFELTARCNLHCKMCYICQDANDKEIIRREHTADEWIWLAEEARDAGMLFLLLTGGEVFLRRDFKKIYEEVSKLGLNIKIYTNATMVTPELAKWLGHIPPSMIEVTMYGASPETYKSICGNEKGYELAIKGIELLQAEGITLTVRTTLIQDNVKDFYEIAEFADKRGIPFGAISYIMPRREEGTTYPEQVRLSPYELAKVSNNIDEYLNSKYKKRANEIANTSYNGSILEYETQHEPLNNISNPFFCNAGINSFWVTWQGTMTPCGDLNEPAAYPFTDGFANSWEAIKFLRNHMPICNECMQCPVKGFCMTCPAKLKSESGFFDRPAPYLCTLAKLKSREEKKLMG